MATLSAVPVLLVAIFARCSCEPTIDHTYHNRNEASQFGELLRPPPPPPLPIIPVPFHGGAGRSQHQNVDFGYQYQVPPPPQPPLPPISPPSDFKFPAPFYKQYNFNFVPPPHPFTTTPSPTIFQKVSQWLFPSQQTSDDANTNNYHIPQVQKNCNPCNLAPWIPVIRYDLSAKNQRENIKQTYGSPIPTASSNVYNTIQNVPQRFNKQTSDQTPFTTDGSHATYGLPQQVYKESFSTVSSTYGPPSPTHTVTIPHESSLSTHSLSSNNPFVTSSYEVSSNSFGSSSSFRNPSSSYGVPSSSYIPSSSIFVTQQPPTSTSSFSHYQINNQITDHSNYISTLKPSTEFELPKVESPTGFKNSYGEPIVNTYALDIPYSITGAESLKIKTEVLPDSKPIYQNTNSTIALANPAPFSLNRGRHIHTLQPVALPNLSVSPLPPIFNARPFRRLPLNNLSNNIKEISNIEQHLDNVNIAKSIPIAEFVHSIEYPHTVIQSPIIDIDSSKTNQTKSYRNIPNSFVVDDNHDITPQASEDHVSASKTNSDSSFESTGVDYANDLYDTILPSELKQPFSVPSNHRPVFADLRGLKDEDIDKYRTESNLQHIDSPLLYLKPSAPHKNFANFVTSSTPRNKKEYEIYDEIPTTETPQDSTLTSAWDESRNYFSQEISPAKKEQNINRSKVVQIIVPYTSGHQDNDNYYDLKEWSLASEKEAQPRKVHTKTETNILNASTESYESFMSTTEVPTSTVTEYYNSDPLNTPPVNDFYDVKEPPFDIIKLQHTIDDWTQQEYSKDFRAPAKSRSNEKYSKQIPDDFLTTLSPITSMPTEANTYNYDIYDHEGSSSIQHVVRENKSSISPKPFKQYNTIERTKTNHQSEKSKESHDDYKPHIYTAASKFRKVTTTPPPWGYIQTSISPLTKEKVYVVTSKPWREKSNSSNEYEYNKKVKSQSSSSDESYDNLPFKSPRFSNRPAFGDQTYLFSKGWHQTINNLENRMFTENNSFESNSDGNEEEEEPKNVESRR
ncbi:unnamed protein product [Colias eurytheme]|nr:unnamed protein product [Colias eurytheme]